MKTLLSSETQQFYLPKPSLRNPRTATILPAIIKTHKQNQSWKLHANAKGFSGTPPVKDSAAKKSSNNKNNKSEDEEIPQVVFERMIRRILVSVGVPMATGLALLHLFGEAKDRNLWDVPLWLPFLTTLITFGASTLGIAYGTLSSSWDSERKGSLLGLEEAQRNWVEMWKEENNGQW
ncbi:putative late blight resistance protein-like protein R1B-19-like [Hibiscus syriacus]|uniref:Late blight resistance protein-like protein R1B-19-like n=1 Tax=Hibiscus syriacus TaxID=106335 RepID=A0A6A2XRE0_HIBSY|nr:uncharacterized protein PAM68-like [Hibiscus syriacus]KAE8678283.1 putative late blight resistance protein-like protein R1B-19-like [Hibiscus syriacus]